jgi:hypothetical protein
MIHRSENPSCRADQTTTDAVELFARVARSYLGAAIATVKMPSSAFFPLKHRHHRCLPRRLFHHRNPIPGPCDVCHARRCRCRTQPMDRRKVALAHKEFSNTAEVSRKVRGDSILREILSRGRGSKPASAPVVCDEPLSVLSLLGPPLTQLIPSCTCCAAIWITL